MSETHEITLQDVNAAFSAMNDINEQTEPEKFLRAHKHWKALEHDYIQQERAKAAQDE